MIKTHSKGGFDDSGTCTTFEFYYMVPEVDVWKWKVRFVVQTCVPHEL